jgi:hypothetical protein
MEVLILLANFVAMSLVMVWATRADPRGGNDAATGFFAYLDRAGPAPLPRPVPRGLRRR